MILNPNSFGNSWMTSFPKSVLLDIKFRFTYTKTTKPWRKIYSKFPKSYFLAAYKVFIFAVILVPILPHSDWMCWNTGKNNSDYKHFLSSEFLNKTIKFGNLTQLNCYVFFVKDWIKKWKVKENVKKTGLLGKFEQVMVKNCFAQKIWDKIIETK